MASLSPRNGSFAIGYKCHKGKRRTVYCLPNTSRRAAETIKERIEALNLANTTQTPPDPITAKWLAELGHDFHKKLLAVDLVPPRDNPAESTLTQFLTAYIAGRKELSNGTIKNLNNTRGKLIEYFGANKQLNKLHEGHADDFRQHLINERYSPATISKHIKYCKQFFKSAARQKLGENIFEDIKAGSDHNSSRQRFITREIIDKVINHCPDDEWKAIVALSRYGGLRTPSETFALKWSDIDWKQNRFTVTSSKTARQDKPERIVPLFPELRPYLETLWDKAPAKATYVLSRHRLDSANLRTRLHAIIKRAKVEIWPRIFHNLRSSLATELAAQRYPDYVRNKWLGHCQVIAVRHYLQVTEQDYQRAASVSIEQHDIAEPKTIEA